MRIATIAGIDVAASCRNEMSLPILFREYADISGSRRFTTIARFQYDFLHRAQIIYRLDSRAADKFLHRRLCRAIFYMASFDMSY